MFKKRGSCALGTDFGMMAGGGVYIFDGNKPPAKCSQLFTRLIGISATTTVSHEIELLGYADGCIDTVQVFTMFVQTKRLEYV